METIKSELLSQFPELVHGFSTKEWGNMSLRNPGKGNMAQVETNNRRFFLAIGAHEEARFFDPYLTHSNNVGLIDRLPNALREELWYQHPHVHPKARGLIALPEIDRDQTGLSGLDACWTAAQGALLTMRPADCAIVFMYDPIERVVGLVHAGTAGVLSGIVPFAIEMIGYWRQTDPKNLHCFISPSISGAEYDLVATGTWRRGLNLIMSEQAARDYDPKQRLRDQLMRAGVRPDRIETHPDCTVARQDKYFSHHAAGNGQRMLAAIGLRA